MKELKALHDSNVTLFTSNNMFDIQGHVNCVNDNKEFKNQLFENARVLVEDSITDDRGTRFLIVGKYEKSNI